MKLARNLVLGLTLLVLLYGGSYRVFYRKKTLVFYSLGIHSRFDFSSAESTVRSFFIPAAEIDCRWNIDRPTKKRLQGHWLSGKSGDFLTFTDDGRCSFQLGKYQSSAEVTYNRKHRGCDGTFQQGGNSYTYIFSSRGSGRAKVSIATADGWFLQESRDLSLAPTPSPAP